MLEMLEMLLMPMMVFDGSQTAGIQTLCRQRLIRKNPSYAMILNRFLKGDQSRPASRDIS